LSFFMSPLTGMITPNEERRTITKVTCSGLHLKKAAEPDQ
jgi:hypothetical protein